MEKNYVESVKASKVDKIKDLFQKMFAEDPILAFVCSVLIFPLGSILITAVIQNKYQQIMLIISTISAIIILICIPLIITRTWRSNQNKKKDSEVKLLENESKERILILQNEAKRKELFDTNTQHRINLLTEAKIQDLQARTAFIVEQSQKYEDHLVIQTAAALQKGFEGSVGALQQITSEEHRIYLKNVLKQLETNNSKYETIMHQVNSLSEGMETLTNEIKTNEEKEMEKKIIFTEQKEDLIWICSNCKKTNNPNKIRCSCGLSKAASQSKQK